MEKLHIYLKKLPVLLMLFGFILTLSACGCTKEKEGAPGTGRSQQSQDCVILDKLPDNIGNKVKVNFGNKVTLLGITAQKKMKNKLEISYYWQIKDKLNNFTNVFVHFTDANNNVLFQNDHVFCPGHQFGELKNKHIKQTQTIEVPGKANGKEVLIKLGMYIPEPDGPRLKIESSERAILDEKDTRASVLKIMM